jgi:hypothetical protein
MCDCFYSIVCMCVFMNLTDDSAAHISEETSGAARAAPIAILVGVAGTASLGKWSLHVPYIRLIHLPIHVP